MGTFIHTADTHLGYQQYHRPERERDYYGAFEQVIDGAIESGADAVIHAGDFFHDSRPSTSTLRQALEQLYRLADNDIPFLGVVGNHEGTQSDQWIDIFDELGLATHLSTDPTTIDDTAFYGLDFVPESQRPHLSYSFEPHDAEHAVLVAHGLFEPISPFGSWDITQVLGTIRVEFDAALLGDDHDPRTQWIDETLITYPGSTERTAIDQRRDRVYNRIETTADKPHWVTQVALETRPHVFLEIDLNAGEGTEHILHAIDQETITDAIVAVLVNGDGEEVTPAEIEEYGRENGAFIVRVSDRRQLAADGLSIDVHFADPDEAIRDHIREMDLSVAAYDIEQKVRTNQSVPKSTIADVIEQEVDDRVDESLHDFTRPAETESASPSAAKESPDPASKHDTDNPHPQSREPVDQESEPEQAPQTSGQLRFDELDT